MAWEGSTRRQTLPSNWQQLRQQCFENDGWRCTQIILRGSLQGTRCKEVPTECDHVGDRDDHRLVNLTSKCYRHHLEKSSSQGGQGRAKHRRRRSQRFRRRESHPGLRE